MHAEHYAVPPETQAAIAAARRTGRRVVAVGTTALRALETYAATGQATGASTLFIYPGFAFRAVQGLVTNFHMPRSTLLLLVSALAGQARILAAYAQARQMGYRFLSYGDAMLILPDQAPAHG
jgi:S-adenosylmethionine:tRNA ribosyltransferase-isomerase